MEQFERAFPNLSAFQSSAGRLITSASATASFGNGGKDEMQIWISQQAQSLHQALKSNLIFLEESLERVEPSEVSDLRDVFKYAMQILLVHVAGADGPINVSESEIISTFLADGFGQRDYEKLRKRVLKEPTLIEGVISLLSYYMLVIAQRMTEDDERYLSSEDVILADVRNISELLIAADDDTSESESYALARVMAPLCEHARQLEEGVDAEAIVEPATAASSTAELTIASSPIPEGNLDPMAELHKLIGLNDVKVEIETLGNLARVFALRKERGLPVPAMSFHLVFTGNPGTGKTTVARLIAQIYGRLGLLSKGHLVEVDRSGLVAEYVGQTAVKTRDALNRADGGILFIDEAYALAKGGGQDFGREAIETVLKAMEDNRDDCIIIVAGYSKEMENFLQSNPGLRSRFSKTIQFPDYSPEEMVQIFRKLASDAAYEIDEAAMRNLPFMMTTRWNSRDETFANARDVRKLFEQCISRHAGRISRLNEITEHDLTTFRFEDIAA